MTYKKQIELLKEKGFRINSKTKRYLSGTGELINKNEFSYKKGETEIDPRGGILDVFISKGDIEYRGSSVCCQKDVFDRKYGFEKAFWEAYQNLIQDKKKLNIGGFSAKQH